MKVEFEIEEKPKQDALGRKGNSSVAIYNLDEVQAIKNAIQEHFLFIGMDNCNNIMSIRLLGVGQSNGINIDSKEIIRTALLSASEKVVLVHNHPSNSLTPSSQDKYLTNYTSKILDVFNIKMIDHIIVTNKDYYSMGKYNEIEHKEGSKEIYFAENIFLKEENQKLKNKVNELNKKIQKNKNRDDR